MTPTLNDLHGWEPQHRRPYLRIFNKAHHIWILFIDKIEHLCLWRLLMTTWREQDVFLHRRDAPASLVSSFLLILFAGNHVSLSYVERWGVAICVGRVLKQNWVVVLRLQTHKDQRSEPAHTRPPLLYSTDPGSEWTPSFEPSHPVGWRMDQGPVEAGGLRVQSQNQLVFAEQGFWVCLWVGLPLREGDDASSA